MKFTIFQESRINKRQHNEDRVAYCYSRDALLMVIADGMGGHLYGDVAAHITAQYLTEAFQREARPAVADPFMFLSRSIMNAHFAILDYADERRLKDTPRTTVVACLIQDSIAYWAHAGDSRLYHLRGGRVVGQTRDHSRVQVMLSRGLITPEEAAVHPERNKVFSCLGGPQQPQIEFSRKTPLSAGDVLVLCSDGLWSAVSAEAMAQRLDKANLMNIVPKLCDAAEASPDSGGDNASIVAVRWDQDYGRAASDAVSTQTLALGAFTTQMTGFDKTGSAPMPDMSDDEIEMAIEEIRSAIEKYSK